MSKRSLFVVSTLMLVVILTGFVVYAVAQAPGGGFQGGGANPAGGRGGFRGFGMGMGGPAIAVAGDAVFVVWGNGLYKFDANTLELLAQTEIPMPQPPAPPAAAPGQ